MHDKSCLKWLMILDIEINDKKKKKRRKQILYIKEAQEIHPHQEK